MSARTLFAGLLLAALAVPAVSQDSPSPTLGWVGYERVKLGKTNDWVQMMMETDKPMYDQLMADGSVLGWGIAVRANHRPGFEWNVLTWVTTPNWAATGKWVDAVLGQMRARSPEETKALEEAQMKLVEPGSHFDEVIEDAHIAFAATPQQFRWFYVGHHVAKPGKSRDFMDLYKSVIVPMGKKLIEDGAIASHGLHTQALHGQHQPGRAPWTHRTWFALPDLASLDVVKAALREAMTREFQVKADAIVDHSQHTDDLLAVFYHAPGPPAEE